jgi:hypothetical protein
MIPQGQRNLTSKRVKAYHNTLVIVPQIAFPATESLTIRARRVGSIFARAY